VEIERLSLFTCKICAFDVNTVDVWRSEREKIWWKNNLDEPKLANELPRLQGVEVKVGQQEHIVGIA
jgi:hypothetical protein